MASKKKTVVQRAVGLAAPVMPAPVAQIMGTRWGSRLFILMLPFLFATGVLTISWKNGIPTVNFDRARALFVGQEVSQQVEQETLRVAQDWREQQQAPAGTQQAWGQAQPASWQEQPAYQRPPQQPAYQQPAYQPQQATQAWGPAYR